MVLCATGPFLVCGAASIEIESVTQRWPWNNKVDIVYHIEGGQKVDAGVYCKVVFTANIGGRVYTIDGIADICAPVNSGRNVATWELPKGLDANDCTMTAALYSSDVPSGDDYMIVDLDSGAVSYEGLMKTQALSNERYNKPVYKSDKMVFRKIPAGGTYPTGDDTNYKGVSTARTWTTDRDYYMAIFHLTQGQYKKICNSNPAVRKNSYEGNNADYRPVENVSWVDFRGEVDPMVAPSLDPAGGFLQRFNHRVHAASGLSGFDLPTELMYEIAQRAGSTTCYLWGDADGDVFSATNHAVCVERRGQESGGACSLECGSLLPNDWGLYDTIGSMVVWVLDDNELQGDLASAASPFVPSYKNGANRRARGGGYWATYGYSTTFRSSYRYWAYGATIKPYYVGFRLAWIDNRQGK
jgi:formylglycine-generating enzyme required for sulfatase activity